MNRDYLRHIENTTLLKGKKACWDFCVLLCRKLSLEQQGLREKRSPVK